MFIESNSKKVKFVHTFNLILIYFLKQELDSIHPFDMDELA